MTLPVKRQNNQNIHLSPWSAPTESFLQPMDLVSFMLSSPCLTTSLSQSKDALLVDATDPSRKQTPDEYRAAIVAISNLLASPKYSLQAGDVVCVFCLNDVLLPSLHVAILATGAVVSPANIVYLPSELRHQLTTTNAKIVVTIPEKRAVVDEALALGPNNVSHIVYLNDLAAEAADTCPYSIEQISAKVSLPQGSLQALRTLLPEAASNLTPESHAYYCFSSGTSGVPKGVITVHNNMVSNVQQQYFVLSENHYTPDKVFGGFLPMSHIYGLSQYIYAMPYIGIKTVLFPKFDLELVLNNIESHRINFMHIVPPVAVLFAKSPLVDKYPGIKSHLNGLISGAAPLSKELASQVIARLGCPLYQAYGLTETSPMTHIFSYDTDNYNVSSIGWLLPGMEARVVAEDGTEIDTPHTPGELWVRGPNVMRGYLHNPEATTAAFADPALQWFRTGDVVILDESAQYFVVDRFKELIKSKGHQVAPAELEAALLAHDSVADVAVTGFHVPHEGTELPRAYIVLKQGLATTPQQQQLHALAIKKWFDSTVARHKQLWGGIVVVDVIPKSPSGKILRRVLRSHTADVVYGYAPKSKL